MTDHWGHSSGVFDQGHNALRKMVLLIGAFFTVLGILIFIFPKPIAFLFAFFLLFTGISALMLGIRIWKLQNQERPLEWKHEPLRTRVKVESPESFQKTIIFVMR